MRNRIVPVLFFLSFSTTSFAQLVGILEDDRSETVNWQKGPAKNRVIRPLFEKKDGEWKVEWFQDREIDWVVALDGRSLGNLKSRMTKEEHGFNAYVHAPVAAGQQLTWGKPSVAFSGWQNTLFYRPMVLVSGGKVEDPDQWKRFQPSPEQIVALRSAFRAKFPKVVNCDKNEKPLPRGAWRYTDAQVRIAGTYRSRNGDALVNMWLEGGQCGVNDGPFASKPFLLRSNGALESIRMPSQKNADSDALSLALLDAGDYDGDGKSEVVFFVSGYNEDGFALFYDSFRKFVVSTWSYH